MLMNSETKGKRPLVLTLFAGASFALAVIAGLVSAFFLVGAKAAGDLATGFGAKGAHAELTTIYLQLGTALAASVMLFVAGFGYLAQRRYGGLFAHGYAVACVTATILDIAFKGANDHTSPALYVIGFGFPVITVLLVNTVFRKNLA